VAITQVFPAGSVFSTEVVDRRVRPLPDARPADLAAELLRCAELCRATAGLLSRADRVVDARVAEPARRWPTPGHGPRWSVEPSPRAGSSPR